MLIAITPAASKYPCSFGGWASLLVLHKKGINEIAMVGIGAKAIASKI